MNFARYMMKQGALPINGANEGLKNILKINLKPNFKRRGLRKVSRVLQAQDEANTARLFAAQENH